MKKLWLLLGVVNCGYGMDTTDDMMGVDIAGKNSENIYSEFASSRNIYSPTQARFKSGNITKDNDSGFLELIKSDMQEQPIASHSHATKKIVDKNIWYTLHPEYSLYPKCTVVENAIGAGNNEYCKANDRINYFCGTDHAINEPNCYLSYVYEKALALKIPSFDVFEGAKRYAIYGKDHPVISSSLRRINQAQFVAKQIECYRHFPHLLACQQTRNNCAYFHNRVISKLASSATEKIVPFDNELTNITNLTRKPYWSYFHDHVLTQLVRKHCIKMIDAIEEEETGAYYGIKSVWKQKMRSHDPRFCDYYTRQKYWPYFRDNVLPELLAKHNCIFKEILAKRALKMIAQYKRKKTQETSGVAGTSSAALLNAESAAHSCHEA